jgi:mRNA interferase MazF
MGRNSINLYNEMGVRKLIPFRGDIYYVNLGDDKTYGSEQRGQRPAVILQNNKGNEFSPTVIIAPITSKDKGVLPVQVKLEFWNESGLTKPSIVLLNHITTVDKERLERFVGTLSPYDMGNIDKSLKESLALVDEDVKVVEKVVEKEVRVVTEDKRTLLQIIKYIENKNNIKLMNYQKSMIKGFLLGYNISCDPRMGKSLVLNGISNFFLEQDIQPYEANGKYKKHFPIDLLFRDMKQMKEKQKGLKTNNTTNNTNNTTNILPKNSKKEPQTESEVV